MLANIRSEKRVDFCVYTVEGKGLNVLLLLHSDFKGGGGEEEEDEGR